MNVGELLKYLQMFSKETKVVVGNKEGHEVSDIKPNTYYPPDEDEVLFVVIDHSGNQFNRPIAQRVQSTYEGNKIIIDESKPPFDGKSYLLNVGHGWTQGFWVPDKPSSNFDQDDGSGWCWYDEVGEIDLEFDDVIYWANLPQLPGLDD
jgi:hypothetical protein